MPIKACIYDLNGVITDLESHIYECWKELAAKLNFQLGVKQYQKLQPLTAKDSLDKILKWSFNRISEAEKQQLIADLNKQYLSLIDSMSPDHALSGFKQFNQQLRNQGIKVAIATPTKHAIRIIDRLDLVLDFDAIVDGGMVEETEAYMKVLGLACEKMDLQASECAYVTRTTDGEKAATQMGMLVYPYLNTQSNKQTDSIGNWENAAIENILVHSS